MNTSKLDVVILEVGLGGRLDATNLIDTDCAVITSIDLDHTELLGKTRDAIGFEKAGIMRAGKPAICSDPLPPKSIIDHAKNVGADLWLLARDFHLGGDKQQWSWAASEGRGRRQYNGLAYPALRGANQLINAAGVLAALDAIRPLLPVTAQAVRNGFAFVELPGRFQIIPGQPTLVLDVAHNPHAIAALTANLDAMSYHPRTHAVFGAMADKDLAAMLPKISPLIDHWYVCDLPTPRAATASALQSQIEAMLMMEKKRLNSPTVSLHTNPQAALDAALKAADPTDRIVVFGSFFTVGGVLQNGIPTLTAPHLT
jgi:dihydrofolate synthase/folylpolyglutamate synthase